MKKLIAIMLTLAFVMGMLPAAWAAEKNAEVYDNTLEYVFSPEAYGLEGNLYWYKADVDSAVDKSFADIKSEKSDPWIAYGNRSMYWGCFMAPSSSNNGYLAWTSNKGNSVKNGHALVFELQISRKGTFAPSITYKATEAGFIADIYLVKKEDTDTELKGDASAIKTRLEKMTADDKLGTVDMYSASPEEKTAVFDEVEITEAGEYLFIIASNGINSSWKPNQESYLRGELHSFALTENTSAKAVENGALEYNTTFTAFDTSLLPSSKDKELFTDRDGVQYYANSIPSGVTDIAKKAWQEIPGLRGGSIINNLSDIATWKKELYMKPDKSIVASGEEFSAMDLTEKTDPYAIDNDVKPTRITSWSMNKSNTYMDATFQKGYYANFNTNPIGTRGGTQRPFVAIRVNVPYAGNYVLSMLGTTKTITGAVPEVYFGKAPEERTTGAVLDTLLTTLTKVGFYHNNTGTDGTTQTVTDNDVYERIGSVSVPSAGEYLIIFNTNLEVWEQNPVDENGYQHFYLSGIKLTPVAEDYVTSFDVSGKTEFKVGDTETLTAKATYAEAGESALTEGVTYKSSNTEVATVSADGKVTAAMAGSALISATLDATGNTASYWITVDAKEAETAVSYIVRAKDSALDGAVSIEGFDAYVPGKTAQAALGETVVAKAMPEYVSGEKKYCFVYWQLANGDYVSNEARYEHTATTNFTLEAVYDDVTEGAEKIAELYKDNGEYIGRGTVVGGILQTPAQPTLTGYVFSKWITDSTEEAFDFNQQLTAQVTRLVARFVKDETVKHAFTASQFKDTYEDEYSYDTPVTLRHNAAKHWTRNGAVVAYGTEYTYHIWDTANIEYSNVVIDEVPLVYLDPVAKDGARMIEYDAAGKTVIEAGILFGAEESANKPTVISYASKARAVNKENHGQFTAIPGDENTRARGYLIYKDGTEYKIVYSD